MIIGTEIIHFSKLPSTNTWAAQLLKDRFPEEGTVIHADYQTAGKGQKGNTWESQEGKNLLFSIILYPDSVEPEEQFIISMALSLAICDFTDKHLFGLAKIKWPNDIYVGNDKIAGILIENSVMGDRIENCIAGIGININQEVFPGSVNNASSLKLLAGNDLDRENCLKQIIMDLDRRYKELLYGNRVLLRNEYISRLYRYGELHQFRTAEGLIRGRITDVSLSGKLTIDTEDGLKRHFSFKEVEFSS